MGAKFDVLLVSIGNNLVRAILQRDLSSEDSWAMVEELGSRLDNGNAFVIDDITGRNQVGKPFSGFLSDALKKFRQIQ